MIWILSLIIGLLLVFLIGFSNLLLITKGEPREKVVLPFGLGFSSVVVLIFILNQFFRLQVNSYLIWISILALALVLVVASRRFWLKEIKKCAKLNLKFKPTLFVVLMIILFLLVFYKAIFLPITDGDAINMYAFTSQSTWSNGFPPIPSSSMWEISFAYPNTNFTLFLNNFFFGLNFGFDEIFVKILVPLFAILNLILIYGISKKLSQKREIAELATVLVLSSIIFSAFIIQAKTTMIELFFPLLAIYSFILYQEERNYKNLILTGIFLGLTLMIKYTFILFVLFFVLSVWIFKKNWKPSVKLLLVAIPVAAIYYLRNLIFFKNPFFPYFFGGINFNPEIYKLQLAWSAVPKYSLLQLFVILIPLCLFIWVFFSLFLVNYAKKIRKKVTSKNIETTNILISTIILFAIYWFFSSAFIEEASGFRHLIPAFCLAAILVAGYIYRRVQQRSITWLFALMPIILILLVYIPYFLLASNPYAEYSKNLLIVILVSSVLISLSLVLGKFRINPKIVMAFLMITLMITPLAFSAFAKRTAPWEFPSRNEVIKEYYPDLFDAFSYISDNLQQDALILTFYNQRFYLNRQILIADSPKVAFIYEEIKLEKALDKLRSMGVTHFMTSEASKETITIWDMSVIHRAHNEGALNLEILYKNEEVTLYKL